MRVYCNDCKTYCHFKVSSEYPTWECPKCNNKLMLRKNEEYENEIICINKFGREFPVLSPKAPSKTGMTGSMVIESLGEMPCNFDLVFEK